jgi:hypothetical protein
LPDDHEYRIGGEESGYTTAMLNGSTTWKKADTRRIQETMVRTCYYGFANEPTANLCLKKLYEMFELERQEGDYRIQRLINKQFKEKLVVSTSNPHPFTLLHSDTMS